MVVDQDLITVMNTVDNTREHMSEGQYLETCNAIKRIHKKMTRPKVPLPRFNNRFTLKCFYMFSYAVSVVKVVDQITKIVSKR